MIKRYLILAAIMLAYVPGVFAITAAEAFLSMPSEQLVYLNEETKDLLVHDYKEALLAKSDTLENSAVADNIMGGKTKLLYMDDNFMRLELTESTELQLVVSSSCVITIMTYKTPEPDVKIDRWNLEWEHETTIDLGLKPESFIRSDVTETERNQVLNSIEFPMYNAVWNPQASAVEVALVIPLLAKEDFDKIKDLLIPVKVIPLM